MLGSRVTKARSLPRMELLGSTHMMSLEGSRGSRGKGASEGAEARGRVHQAPG